jgi:hypothetical protein
VCERSSYKPHLIRYTVNSQRAAAGTETVVGVDDGGLSFAVRNEQGRQDNHHGSSFSPQKNHSAPIGPGASVTALAASKAEATFIPDTQAQPQLETLGRKTVSGPFNVSDSEGQGASAKFAMYAGASMVTRRGQSKAAGLPGGTPVDATSDTWRPGLAGSQSLRKVPPIRVISATLRRQDGNPSMFSGTWT